MRKRISDTGWRSVPLLLCLGGLLFSAAPAGAVPLFEFVWTATTGSGTPGGSAITADNGDVLTGQVVLGIDAGRLNAYVFTLLFDTVLDDELDLVSAAAVPFPGPELDTLFVENLVQDSTLAQEGDVHSFGGLCTSPGGLCGPVAPTFAAAELVFEVANVSTDGDDVFPGLYTQVGALDSFAIDDALVIAFDAINGQVNAATVPEPAPAALLLLGLSGIHAARRFRA